MSSYSSINMQIDNYEIPQSHTKEHHLLSAERICLYQMSDVRKMACVAASATNALSYINVFLIIVLYFIELFFKEKENSHFYLVYRCKNCLRNIKFKLKFGILSLILKRTDVLFISENEYKGICPVIRL